MQWEKQDLRDDASRVLLSIKAWSANETSLAGPGPLVRASIYLIASSWVAIQSSFPSNAPLSFENGGEHQDAE
ncbi:hypothetical protein XH98_06465 [Bradyrhizobium sp. CCBAU 51745]|nr:hypothetical protein [Bradyrhizobium sp. CCBAU 51745]